MKSNTYIDYNKEINWQNSKFKIGDVVRTSKYKKIFARGYDPNWSEEVFVIKKIKNFVLWIHVISDLKSEEIVGTFYKKEWPKPN